MKTDLTEEPAQPDFNSSVASTVQAPLPVTNTAIGEVIAELKAHNQARTFQRSERNKEGTPLFRRPSCRTFLFVVHCTCDKN